MTVDLGRLVAHLNEYLQVGLFQESAINGLQVSGKKRVRRVALAVDGVLETFEKAVAEGADLLIVHHGIYWGHQWALRGADYKRVKVLMDAELALYAAHLPLDAHPEVGHAVNLLRAAGADEDSLNPFGNHRGQTIGFSGEIRPTKRDDFSDLLGKVLGGDIQVLPFGPDEVRRVACVTGQGADFSLVREAKINNIHYYISGEAAHPIYHFCKEQGVNLGLGGHYRTETFGLKALAAHLERQFDLSCVFIEVPTGM